MLSSLSYFPSAAAILLLLSNASYKEHRCKLFVNSVRYVRTAPLRLQVSDVLDPQIFPRVPCIFISSDPTTCYLPSPSKGYSHDTMFRPSHAQELPFPWSLCVSTGMLKEFAGHKHNVSKRCVCVCVQ
jgi:hypothetical protein